MAEFLTGFLCGAEAMLVVVLVWTEIQDRREDAAWERSPAGRRMRREA